MQLPDIKKIKILSHETSVGNKRKQIEDEKHFVISNIVSIVSSPSKKSDLKMVHAIKDLIQCSVSCACLFFALYLNQMSQHCLNPPYHH